MHIFAWLLSSESRVNLWKSRTKKKKHGQISTEPFTSLSIYVWSLECVIDMFSVLSLITFPYKETYIMKIIISIVAVNKWIVTMQNLEVKKMNDKFDSQLGPMLETCMRTLCLSLKTYLIIASSFNLPESHKANLIA